MLEGGGGGRERISRGNGVLALLVFVLFIAALFACRYSGLLPFPIRPVVTLTPPSSLPPQGVPTDPTATALAAISTQSVAVAQVTETALAQPTVAYQATQTSVAQASVTAAAATVQAAATLTAFPLTATPGAALLAEEVRAQQQAQRRANWRAFVLSPALLGLLALVVLVVLVLIISAYHRLMPVVEMRLRALPDDRRRDGQLLMLDGQVVECEPIEGQAPQPALRPHVPEQLPHAGMPHVEIVAPSESPVDFWIAEAEQQLWFTGEGNS